MYITALKAMGQDYNAVLLDTETLKLLEPLRLMEKAFICQTINGNIHSLILEQLEEWQQICERRGEVEQAGRIFQAAVKIRAKLTPVAA